MYHRLPSSPANLISPVDVINEAEQFKKLLCQRPLPNHFDAVKLSSLQVGLLSCIEGLYRDRLRPVVGEIQRRLRSSGWKFLEIQSMLPLCARNSELYTIVPPADNEPPHVFLRNEPPWFKGWISEGEESPAQVASVWEELEKIVLDDTFHLKGGINDSALLIWQRVLPIFQHLTLGEVRNMVEFAVGKESLLAYDPLNGSRLHVQAKGGLVTSIAAVDSSPDSILLANGLLSHGLLAKSASQEHIRNGHDPRRCEESMRPKSPASSPIGGSSAAKVLASELRARPLPESLANSPDELKGHQRSLRICVESLYRDRLKPTLAEIQRRLTERAWGPEKLRAVLPLSAREPETYEIVAPVDGRPLCIFLRSPPDWFDGWVDAERSEAAYSSEVWESLEAFLREGEPVLEGGITGAALALRQRALPHLQHLSLGEIRDLVKRAVSERGLLAYAGGTLRLQATATQPASNVRTKVEGVASPNSDRRNQNMIRGKHAPSKAKSKAHVVAENTTKTLIKSADQLAQVLRHILPLRVAGHIHLTELTQFLQDNCGLLLSPQSLGCDDLVDVFKLRPLRQVVEFGQSSKSGLMYVKLILSKDAGVQPFNFSHCAGSSNRVYSVI